MSEAMVLLVDNGSRQPAATLSLRSIAARLADACGRPVHPVSLQHAQAIPPDALDGRPASVFAEFLRAQLAQGRREFVVVPLFFGASRALSAFIPQQIQILTDEFGPFTLRQADVLVPLPNGEPLLADILAAHVAQCSAQLGTEPTRVVVLDHGSPVPEVSAVRRSVSLALRDRLAARIPIDQAVMERRPGAEYDFNGPLLADELDRCAAAQPNAAVILAMLFISPGRHAGPDGDVADICREAMVRNPGLRVAISPLVGEHPLLIQILNERLRAVL
jgi:sirohydrochlorin ferrochelatase